MAAALPHNDVLPFYQDHGLAVGAIRTDNGREFRGTQAHPFERYLALNDLEHRRRQVRRRQTNGFVERFHGTVQTACFQVALRQRFYQTPADLPPDLDAWRVHYTTERPHRGDRNRGKRPMDTINDYLTLVRQVG